MSEETYTCFICRRTFSKGWSDEEAKAESDRDYPSFDAEDMATICDDCYVRFKEWEEKGEW